MLRKPRKTLRRVRIVPGGPRISIGTSDGLWTKLNDQCSTPQRRMRTEGITKEKAEKAAYRVFQSILDLANQAVARYLDSLLRKTDRSQKDKRRKMSMTSTQTVHPEIPTGPSYEEFDELICLASSGEQAAMEQLSDIIAKAPPDWHRKATVHLQQSLVIRGKHHHLQMLDHEASHRIFFGSCFSSRSNDTVIAACKVMASTFPNLSRSWKKFSLARFTMLLLWYGVGNR